MEFQNTTNSFIKEFKDTMNFKELKRNNSYALAILQTNELNATIKLLKEKNVMLLNVIIDISNK